MQSSQLARWDVTSTAASMMRRSFGTKRYRWKMPMAAHSEVTV